MSATSYFQVCDDPCESDCSPSATGPIPISQVIGLQAVLDAMQAAIDALEAAVDVLEAAGAPAAVGVFVVGSVAAAQLIPSASTNLTLAINGNMTGGDGFSHLNYTWDNASAAAHNPDTVIASSDAGVGRWIQN